MTRSDSPLFLAAIGSLVLALVKAVAFAMTGSMVILASLVDSFVDAVISGVNHRVQKLALEDADEEHRFGHGGYEVISGFIQGSVIALSGLFILWESLRRIAAQLGKDAADPHMLSAMPVAIGTMLFSAIAGLLIQAWLSRWEKKLSANFERSLSLSADRSHYLADFWVNLAGAIGLTLVWFYEVPWLDSLFGILGGLLTLRTAMPVLRTSFDDILHAELDTATQGQILQTVREADARIHGVHRLRTRRSGPVPFADFHLKLPADLSLEDAHEVEETVKSALRAKIPAIDVFIHLDPDTEPDDEFWDHKKD